MRRNYYQPLGKYIEQVDIRNRDLRELALLGVSVEKNLISSVANTNGTDMSKYKILHKSEFVYIADTSRRGDKIAIAINNTGDDVLCSSAYTTFRIKDTTELLPEYLMMWAKRPEFDRYARYMSHGSVRELFSWEDMCNVMLPVPSIDEQRRIVSEYQTVERRIANNEALIQKLEETAQAIYHHTFVEGIDEEKLPEGWRKGKLGDIADFSNGKAIKPSNGNIPIYGGNGIIGFTDEYNAENAVVIGRVGANCGCVYFNEAKCWVNDNSIKGTSKDGQNGYLFFLLKSLSLNSVSEGTGQPLLTQTILNGLSCSIPDAKSIIDFNDKALRMLRYKDMIIEENTHLRTLLSLLTSRLS